MRFVPAILATAAIGFLVCLQSTSSARLEEFAGDQPADSIAAHVDSLRVEARYAEALASARDFLALRASESSADPTRVKDAKRLVATLEFASALSEEARKELAQADKLERDVIAAYEGGNFSAGQESARRQLEIRRRLLGPQHVDIAESLDDLGDLTRRSGDYAGAEQPLRESLAMRRSILGENHPDVAESLNDLGVLLQALGNYAEAESLLRESMETFRKVHAGDHPDVAESLDNLADFLRARGSQAPAESLYRESLEMRRRLFGEKHSTVATSLNNLAGAVRDRGDYAGAEPLYREALEMTRSIYGEQHPHVADIVNNLGLLHLDSGNYAAAEPLFREALAMRRSLLGPDHPKVGTSLNNLASIFYYQGDYAQAEPLFRESLVLARKRLGEEHAEVAQSLNNLAGLLYQRGDYAGAEPLFREALALHRKLYGEEHRTVVKSMHNLAAVLHSSGNTAEAEPLFRQSIELGRKLLGDEHPEVVKPLNNLANLLRSRGDLEEAERLYRDVLAARRKVLGPDHPDVARSLNDLALCLEKRGNLAEAESLFQEAIVLRRRVLGDNHPALAASLEDLAHLHQAIGQHAKAEPLLVEAAEVYEKARLRAGAGLSRAGFQQSPYPALAAAYLAMGRVEQAWPSVERDLGRALADLLLSAEKRHLSPEESAREDSLKSALGNSDRALAAFRKVAAKDSTMEAARHVEAERTRLLEAEVAWNGFQQEMAKKHPVTEGEAFSLEKVQKALGSKSAILGWLDVKWGEDRGESRAYVIRKKGAVAWSEPTAWEAGAIPSEQVAALRRELTDPRGSAIAVERESRKIFDLRISTLEKALEGVDELMVVQYGPMSVLPIEALVDTHGNFIGDRFRVSYVTSGTIYAWLIDKSGKARKPGPALLLADPPFKDSDALDEDTESSSFHRSGQRSRSVSFSFRSRWERGGALAHATASGNAQRGESHVLVGTRLDVVAWSGCVGARARAARPIRRAREVQDSAFRHTRTRGRRATGELLPRPFARGSPECTGRRTRGRTDLRRIAHDKGGLGRMAARCGSRHAFCLRDWFGKAGGG
jgi:tetratricopeptide (TPR) repeat protein